MKKQTSFVQKTENKIARWSDNKKTLVGCAIVGSLWTSLGAATLLCWSTSKETSPINQKTSVVRQNLTSEEVNFLFNTSNSR